MKVEHPRNRFVAKDGYVLEQRKKLWFLKDPAGNEVAKAMGMRVAMFAAFTRRIGGRVYCSERWPWRTILWADDGTCLKQSRATRLWHFFDARGDCLLGGLRLEDALKAAFHQTWKHS